MPGTFFGFNTALRGMQAQQRGIYTTAHNIANANTEGYTRQRVVLATLPAYPVPSMNHPGGTGWQIGTGVDSQETRRLRDEFLDTQIRRETGSLGQWEQVQDVLKQVEIVFNEPSDTGLSTLMSQFWAAWQELSKYAESSPVRTTVVETANALAEAFNHSFQQLATIMDDINQTVELKVTEINSLAQQIADLNGQIKNIIAVGDQPNDLMDQRDLLLDRLSKIIDFTITTSSNGTITITLGGGGNLVEGVDGSTIHELQSSGSAVSWVEATQPALNISNGELFGLQKAKSEVDTYITNLDTLVSELATAVNNIHTSGDDLSGTAGENFFVANGGGPITAGNIQVNPNIKTNVTKIAAASSGGGPGDGSNALAIAQLQHELIPGLSNTTFDDYYKNFTAKLGVDAHEAVRMTTNQGVLVDQLTNRKESISGVSLDEEMASMLQYQRAYEAAARMITTLDSMLDKIINGMGVTR
ncbi:Flagellar hook-associated protein, FlgK [Moorella glycerini]|uniref:Flagellar hook-associated protein 1 n=1 Tax=Neomoorella stamsii TaxID=1266720 RepID=A0A9X7J2L8_9FIRM|nr:MULTISPECIES: flagellar hook-associated protein FlgK [Moorella]PRR72331.1 Flagellar hook-associated protein 1 [Moorella stamsii]CEP68858.1 Flagellar hook-associated protein, FlgK [Moorella glycerini]